MKLTFNQPLNNWNVSNDVTRMTSMFGRREHARGPQVHGRLRRGRARLGRRRRSARAPVTALEATWARRCCCPYASTGPRVWIRPGKAGKPRTP